MKGWTFYPSLHNRNRSAFGSPDDCERRRSMTVALLLGGFYIPGFLEYTARGDQVTFTITNRPHSAPGELDPENGDEVTCQAGSRTPSRGEV